jgi:hypothetical protein
VPCRTPEGKEQALVPVAIELKHKQTQAQDAGLPQSAGVVYARQQLKGDAVGQVGPCGGNRVCGGEGFGVCVGGG